MVRRSRRFTPGAPAFELSGAPSLRLLQGWGFWGPPSRETTQATERFLTSFTMTKRLYFLSPIEALESGNKIEVLVPAYKLEGMLAAERGDPKIVSGNGLAFPFQFEADG